MLFTEATGRESQSNEFPELEPFKMAAEELIEYLPYIYHPKIDTEHEKSYQKVKTRTFAHGNKNKCHIKTDHSSTCFSLAVSAIFFRSLCRLCQISSGRDGRASKIGRRPIEHTGIALPILAALPLAQTNRLKFHGFFMVVLFLQSRQCRSKIRLHILCRLILIWTGSKGNYSREEVQKNLN